MTRPPTLAAETAALLVAVGGAWALWARQRPPRWALLWRGASAALLALFVVRGFGGARGPRSLAVVFDGSASMASSAEAGAESRWDRARRAASTLFPSGRDAISYFVLGNGLRPVPAEALDRESPKADRSDFSELAQLKTRAPAVDGVVFFSDGRGEPGGEAAVRSLGVPVLAVGSAPDRSADAAVESLGAPATAVAGTETAVTVRWRRSPAGTDPLRLSLWNGDRRIAEGVAAASTDTVGEAVLRFRPAGPGAERYRAQIDALPGERYLDNNARTFSLEVQRDRMRVLYLCGRPGPHYGFLRAQLKTDPAVDLVSFVILRDPEDAVGFSETDLSLIPFPTAETLMAQLKTFNVVILENFPLTGFGLGPRFAAAVRDYLEKGGGLLIAGEGRYWANGGPGRGNALESLLPADRFRPAPEGRWSVRALPAAQSVLRLDRARWDEAPVLETSAGDRWPELAGGAALTEAPGGAPHLSAKAAGRGRIMVLACLTDWRWALGVRTPGPWLYQRFWENIVRWLGESPDRRAWRIDRPDGPVAAGVSWPVTVRFTGIEAPASVDMSWRSADGAEHGVLRPTMESPGVYAGAIRFSRPGDYLVSVRSPLGGDRLWVEAALEWDESRDVRPDPAALARLAAATGGEAVEADSLTRRRFRRWRNDLPSGAAVADAPGAPWALAALACWVLEWVVRKRRGER